MWKSEITKLPQPFIKGLIFVVLQLAIYSFFWYLNIVVLSTYVPALRSMSALSAVTSKSGGMFLDFTKSYACAQIAKTNPHFIWDAITQANTLTAILNAKSNDKGTVERAVYIAPYTPQSLLLVMPLTLLPLNQAIIIFESFSILLAILTISVLIKRYQNYSNGQLIIWWLIIFATFPFMQNLCLGQMTFILAGLISIFLLTWNNKTVIVPAVCLALTLAIKPQRALILIIMLLATKRFRLLTFTILFSILLLSICALTIGIEPLLAYPSKLQNIENARNAFKMNWPIEWTTSYCLGVPAVISFICQKSLGHGLVIWSSLLDFILVFSIWRKAAKLGTHTYPFAFAITVLIDLMIGPYAFLYDIFMINLGFAMTLPVVELSKFSELKTHALELWFLAFSFFPLASWYIESFYSPSGGALHMMLLAILLLIASWNLKNVISSKPLAS